MATNQMGAICTTDEFSVTRGMELRNGIREGDEGMPTGLLIVGAFLGGLGVAIGAFGAHSLRPLLSPDMAQIFETGVRYHMYHVVGVLTAGWGMVMTPHARFRQAGYAFTAGIIVFSGSLYAMALSGMQWLGILTPFGGTLLLIGWVLLLLGFWAVNKSV